MNEGIDIASAVVNEQLSRMLEQERKRLELLPMPGLVQGLPIFSKDQMFEIALHMIVMTKILMAARLN